MHFIVYSKPNCQFCTKAVQLLTIKGLDYEELKLGEDFTRDDLLSWFPHAKTFPQIEVNEGGKLRLIGGFVQLQEELNRATNSES